MDIRLYTASQTRDLDRTAIETFEVPGYTLMTRAGEICYRVLRGRWPEAAVLRIVCGAGNNAGDGYVIGRLALEDGKRVDLVHLVDPEKLKGDAAQAWKDYRDAGGEAQPWSADDFEADLVVDAILGTGLDRPPEGDFGEAVEAINASGLPVLAVDIPTGVHADTGRVLGCAVRATTTVTFIGRKRGLYTGEGVDYTGDVVFDGLKVPDAVYDEVPAQARLIGKPLIGEHLGARRPPNAHKGNFGAIAIFGGHPGMPGAVRMAGEAALRSGAGLVKVATHPDHAGAIPLACAALMSEAVADAPAVKRIRDWSDVLALGPGLGQGDWSRDVFEAALDGTQPVVLDADALNLLARDPRQRENWILTPHPGEAARLLDCSVGEIQADRFEAAQTLAERYGGVCILKGAGTVIADHRGWSVCRLGNPGMATAGMGDVLTGVTAAMLGQGFDLMTAAELAVCVHAHAGDLAARAGQRGMLATDLLAVLRPAVNPGP
ncbi:MAG: NAD(P)H-hydrate dehydratase [Xanthomonadales bacterium]|nr:NAD(P)H-hydrate dehydratase [Xanthomonadales bacterium]